MFEESRDLDPSSSKASGVLRAPCKTGCGFFGAAATTGLCSGACFAAALRAMPVAELAARAAAERAERLRALEAAVRAAGGRSDEEVLELVAVYDAAGSTASEIEAEVAKLEVLRAERAAFDTAVLAGLGEEGATIARIRPFGDCLFGAVAHQVYGDEALHGIVREACCDMLAALRKRDARRTAAGAAAAGGGLAAEPEVVKEGGLDAYLEHMRRPRTWGDGVCLRALADVYGRCVIVYTRADGGAAAHPDFAPSLHPGAPALQLTNFSGICHFDSVETGATRAHRLPRERAGEVELAAVARVLLQADEGRDDEPASPHGLLASSAPVEHHVRGELTRSLSGGGGEGAKK